MPITRKEFEKGDFKAINLGNPKDHPVYKFLEKNSNHAWRIKEIAEKLDRKPYGVRTFMKKLKKNNLVLHKPPWFIVKKK